jgi:2-methylcitrate dehydratase PrpD
LNPRRGVVLREGEKTMQGRLAEFILETNYGELSKEVVHQAKRCILDFMGVALAGSRVGLAPVITDKLSSAGGEKEAMIIGDGRRMPALHAALVNGVRGHTLDMDDGHRYANGHPGVVTIPAVAALGEREDSAGREMIEAAVVGYEIFIRIATGINPSHLKRGFHTTGTVGPLAAAASCSKLLGLNKREIASALAIAGLQGAGLLEVLTSGQMMKPLHAGRAAQAGLMAALLAQKGAEGPEMLFEGEKGFFRAFSDAGAMGDIGRDLGRNFEIRNTYFKLHAACRHVHPALDAVREIMDANEVDINGVWKIDVHTYSVAYQLAGGNREAKTELAAKFSLPVSIGLMLRCGTAGVDQYTPENIANPVVQELAKKVDVIVDEKRDDVYPRERGARVDIETSQGAYSAEVTIPKGEPENPASDDELKGKFFHNAGKVLPAEKATALLEMIFHIETASARELMNLLS